MRRNKCGGDLKAGFGAYHGGNNQQVTREKNDTKTRGLGEDI